MQIHIKDVAKNFGSFSALRGVNLDIRSGELIALLGPSGSGKTTLLRAIAGLESVDRGQILFGGEDASRLPVQGRRVGFVFQHYALFKHMTIGENVAFGLRVRDRRHRPAEDAIQRRVQELLALVQLPGLEKRYPNQLSGGQKQRVALARALAIEPRVLLLDEPFGALDAKVRKELRRWLRRLHDEMHVTSVFVTHDQEEALEVADRIVVMNHGRIEQLGAPDEVYQHPATPFVYEFLGDVNLFHGREYARPHEIDVFHESETDAIPAKVEHIAPRGAVVRVELSAKAANGTLEVELTRERQRDLALQPGQDVYVRPRVLRVFPNSGRPRIPDAVRSSGG